jgi:hypothetical protein
LSTPPKKAAKSARRKLALALLGALIAFAAGALAVFAAGGKPDFSLAASPTTQTVTQGQSTTYSVTITRDNGLAEAIVLSASGLPSGAAASWKLSDGTSSNVIPPSQNGATLTVQTAASTPAATSSVTITAVAGKLTRTAGVSLLVQSAAEPNFSLSTSPATRTLLQGDETSYTVNVVRTGGFNGAVSLSVGALPKGVTASWSPGSTVGASSSSATLIIATEKNTQAGTYSLAVTGTAAVGASSASRSTAPTLVVDKTKTFEISGDLATHLYPGASAPLNLTLTNPYNFDLRIGSISVSLEEATSRPGCSGSQNFEVTQMPASAYPVTLPSGLTRTLTQLGVSDASKPRVRMINQPWNQEACRQAGITLQYSGSAGK